MNRTPIILTPRAKLVHGVSCLYSNEAYAMAIEKAGATLLTVNTVSPTIWDELLTETADGILFQGGCDIHPHHYGQTPTINVDGCDKERDYVEAYVMKVCISRDIPILAICRGMQLLNVVREGELYQELPELMKSEHLSKACETRTHLAHTVSIVPNSSLYKALGGCRLLPVNSMHHQGIRTLGTGLKALAKSPDALIEAIEVPYRKFCLGVQWHPEELTMDIRELDLLKAFVNACKN